MPTALLCTLGSFALILLLARIKVPLSVAILLGAVALSVAFGRRDPREVGLIILNGAVQPKTVALVIIVAMLLTLSELMRAAGQLERIVSLARVLLRRPAVAMAAMPVLIGLIPMPGGALFSASMVQSAAGKTKLSGGRLSAINYWFRHIWEFWWPLYPAVLVATEKAEMEIGRFAAFQWPLTIFMALAGLLIFRKTHTDLHAAAAPAPPGTARKLLRATSSIWLIVVVYVAGRVAIDELLLRPGGELLAAVFKYLPVFGGLVASLLWTVRMNRLGVHAFARIFSGRSIYMMALIVIGVMVFAYTVEAVEAADEVAAELRLRHVPGLLVVALLPFIAGLVTGLGVGFVGASFPIVLPLAAIMADHGSMPPYVMLAYACGHMGMMLSPMHLCQVVSNQYFKTGFASLYRHIVWPMAATLALAAAYFIVLRMILG